jgi:hypothetical protein
VDTDMVNIPTHQRVLIAVLFPHLRTTGLGLHLPHPCRACPIPHLVLELLPLPSLLPSMPNPCTCQDRVSLCPLVNIISLLLIQAVSTGAHGVLPKEDAVGAECIITM